MVTLVAQIQVHFMLSVPVTSVVIFLFIVTLQHSLLHQPNHCFFVQDARKLSWYTISAVIYFVVLSVDHVFMPLPAVL